MPHTVIKDIRKGWQVIDEILGQKQNTYAFRPPYGKLNIFSMLYLCCRKIPICYWSLDIGDTWFDFETNRRDIGMLISNTGGAVLLAHDFDRSEDYIDEVLLESISRILAMARKEGLRMITMSDLLLRE